MINILNYISFTDRLIDHNIKLLKIAYSLTGVSQWPDNIAHTLLKNLCIQRNHQLQNFH